MLERLSLVVNGVAQQESPKLIIHMGAQPNNSPHAGTILAFACATLLARNLAAFHRETIGSKLRVAVHLDLVDTAPDSSKQEIVDGVVYQRSHRSTLSMNTFMPDYNELMHILAETASDEEIEFRVTRQEDLLRCPTVKTVLAAIIKDRVQMGQMLNPKSGTLCLRAACPVEGCGRSDKHGKKTQYSTAGIWGIRSVLRFLKGLFLRWIFPFYKDDTLISKHEPTASDVRITFNCYKHGPYTLSMDNIDDVARLEMNTPLRNLVRTYAYGLETLQSKGAIQHMRVTGGDYAGFYQEAFLMAPMYRLSSIGLLPRLPTPVIFYSPLILDWAGSKLSKSLYVQHKAYEYLKDRDLDYLLSYDLLKKRGYTIMPFLQEVETWFKHPKKLFRPYTVEAIHELCYREGPRRVWHSSVDGKEEPVATAGLDVSLQRD
uniref:Uncharacterized protein n=1 Tax=Moniliophthora roreri TaxID=221103 RepID=A0A0W0EUS4_MONRR